MTAVFVYFFVRMPYDFLSRLQLHRQRAKKIPIKLLRYSCSVCDDQTWVYKDLIVFQSRLLSICNILYYSYYGPIGIYSLTAQHGAVISSHFMVCSSYMLSL